METTGTTLVIFSPQVKHEGIINNQVFEFIELSLTLLECTLRFGLGGRMDCSNESKIENNTRRRPLMLTTI